MTAEWVTYDEFVAARGTALVRFAFGLAGDMGAAEDLVQDCLAKAFARRHALARMDRPEAYVRKMIVNAFLSSRRKRSSREVVGLPPDHVGGSEHPTDHLVERDLMWSLLRQLPDRQRAVLVLRYYEDLPDREIAALLGCAEGTVRSLATRAFAALRTHPQHQLLDAEVSSVRGSDHDDAP